MPPRVMLGERRVFAVLLVVLLCGGLVLAFLVLSQSSVEIRPSDAAAIDRELDAIRRRFPVTQPYITVVRNGHVTTTVHHEQEPPLAARITTLRGVAWDPRFARRVSLSTPYWVFVAGRWKAKAFGAVARSFDRQLGLDIELPDLAPLGPGLVLDERHANGRRVLVWTE